MDVIQGMIGELAGNAGFYAGLAFEHIQISGIAILIAIAVGGLAGILIAEFQRAARPMLAVVNLLYTIPSISMLGFLIPFSGVGDVTAVIALTVYALLPMVRNTHTGLTGVDPAIVEAARGMGSTRLQVLLKVRLPLAGPVIMAGIRNMATMSIALAGIASFVGAGGLGVAIYRGITTNNGAMTMAGSLVIAMLALAVDALLGVVERRMGMRTARARRQNRVAAGVAAAVCIMAVAGAGAGVLLAPGSAGTIRIASKPMTEQYVITEMLRELIEDRTDLTVELTQGVGGGTSNIMPAMESGEFDLYPEYTSTGWNLVLGEGGVYSEDLFGELADAYEDELAMSWRGMYGFSDQYGLVVRREIAERYGLRTYSDLARVADELTLGAEYDFYERPDGYDALCETYGMSFGDTMDMDIGVKYEALAADQVDAMVVFTTDGQLSQADAVLLEDDLGFFPSARCGNVVRDEVLEEHPELGPVLDELEDTIADDEMARMNYEVEAEGADPADVAHEFLVDRGLIEEG